MCVRLTVGIVTIVTRIPEPACRAVKNGIPGVTVDVEAFTDVTAVFTVLLECDLFFVGITAMGAIREISDGGLVGVGRGEVFASLVGYKRVLAAYSGFRVGKATVVIDVTAVAEFSSGISIGCLSTISLSPL